MKVLLSYLDDPDFQIGVGVDLEIHQATVYSSTERKYKILSQIHPWMLFPNTILLIL